MNLCLDLLLPLLNRFPHARGDVNYVEIDGKEKSIGWVFEKSEKYEDTQKPYVCENWITVYKREPIKKTTWEIEYA